ETTQTGQYAASISEKQKKVKLEFRELECMNRPAARQRRSASTRGYAAQPSPELRFTIYPATARRRVWRSGESEPLSWTACARSGREAGSHRSLRSNPA